MTQEISDITKPTDGNDYKMLHKNNKVLVASAEQSFLYQSIKGYLPIGRWQATTPCYRFENQDGLHQKNFMKTELFLTDDVRSKILKEMVACALYFFQQHIPQAERLKTSDGFDIVYGDVELGSYGIRSHLHLNWIYGTGIAEPRFSNAIKQYKLCG